MDKKVKKTLKCMIIGLLLYNIALIVVSAIVMLIYTSIKGMDNKLIYILKNEICVVIGFIISSINLYILATSLSKAIDSKDIKFARRHTSIMSFVRLLIFAAVLGIVINEKAFGISGGIMFALSILGIKIGAFLVPYIEKKIK